MSEDNLYAPPRSDPGIVPGPEIPADFYVVSLRKFTALFIATLGMYAVYWFYRNWSLYKAASGENIWPVPRAMFAFLFVSALFERVHRKIADNSSAKSWRWEIHGNVLAITMVVSQVLDRMANKSIGSPYTDIVSVAMLVPLFFLFYRAQQVINAACGDPGGMTNDRFTPANYLWIALGAIFWLLVAAGVYFMAKG